ncbi:MAG: RNA polymerase sigma factor [Firmicutes bacterium]|nr:RNA polymerase sigma factor [Bacillota bacterium]
MNVAPLLKRIQEGDWQAFEMLIEQYSGKALRTAYLITGRKDIIEDAVQDAFVQCYRKIKGLRDPATFETWFYRLLTRICWRLTAREKGPVSLDSLTESGQECALRDDPIGDALEAGETKRLVQQALGKLSIPLRTTVVLRYYNDLPLKEISRVLGCREGTVKSRLHTALKQLADELKLIAPELFLSGEADTQRAKHPGKEGLQSEA